MAIIKQAEFTTCDSCSARHRVSDEVFGCDHCGQELAVEPLRVLVCDNVSQEKHFCSWQCAFSWLQRLPQKGFASLPYLDFNNTTFGQTPADFWAAMWEVSND